MGRVRFTSRINEWTSQTENKLDNAVLEMATDIHRIAVMLAPEETSALKNSGRIEKVSTARYKVIFGGGRVPYARRRHYENKKTPSSLKYLQRAGESVSRNIKRYIKGI